MTEQEVKDFFVSRGASPNFKLVNGPMFQINKLVPDGNHFKIITETKSVDTIPFNNTFTLEKFIQEYLIVPESKIYIYNNMFEENYFNDNMKQIRFYDDEDSGNRLILLRKYKLDKIKNKLNG